MGELERRFIGTVRDTGVLPEGASVTAAVSGGSDSMAMLHMLEAFRGHMGWDLSVLHIHHGVREAAADDAEMVEASARLLGLPFTLRRIAPPKGGSLEDGLSRLRHGIYAEEAGEGGLVAVAHTATDRAETLLMRLLEGAGPRGLGGMSYRGVGPVRRPMLRMQRHELRDYLSRRGLSWAEDETNTDPAILRNRVRSRVLPALEAVSPGAALRVAASAELLSGWRDAMDALTSDALARIAAGDAVSREGYAGLHRQLRLSVLWELCGRPRSGRGELEKTDRWIMSGGTGSHRMPGGRLLRAGVERLAVTCGEGSDEAGRG
jgi:tRNA(Ile)-lysidine synthase